MTVLPLEHSAARCCCLFVSLAVLVPQSDRFEPPFHPVLDKCHLAVNFSNSFLLVAVSLALLLVDKPVNSPCADTKAQEPTEEYELS